MKKFLLLPILLLAANILVAQSHAAFPQAALNQVTSKVLAKYPQTDKSLQKKQAAGSQQSVQGMLQKMEQLKNCKSTNPMDPAWVTVGDTIIVGATPNDTLVITGNWTHYGPILVLGNGVLIFYKATVVDTGEIYVFQNGQMLADSSSLTFPQQYFYQRSLIAVQTATVYVANSSFNYSGMSHNLVIGGNATVAMQNVHENDWTTCGLFGKPTLFIDGMNLAGEYILSDSATAIFKNTDTLLLWHQFPDTALINFAYPNGDTVYNYVFNKTITGVKGIEYNVSADTCHNVMWAMMPVNGSTVTISNSKIRAIGCWFQHNDTANVQGLNDNSSYTNFVAPLSDRYMNLINTDVQTWSLYVFDKSHIDVANCQVGEVGTQQHATVTQVNPFLLDGSGGYYWATDTSSIVSFGATVYSYCRSEKNGIFIFAYGNEPFSAPQAIGKSLLVYVQSNSPADPVFYDGATVFMDKIDGPDTSYTNTTFPVIGSAWIDWASGGNGWMNFAKYSVYYQLQGNTGWTRIVKDSMFEYHHAAVANWNTLGLAAGNYNLKLTVWNNFGDSVEAVKQITLKPGGVGIASHAISNGIKIYPNPNSGSFTISLSDYENASVEIYNTVGQKVLSQTLQSNTTPVDFTNYSNGIYQVNVVKNNTPIYSARAVKQ